MLFFFFSSRRRHTRFKCDWSSDVCSSDLHQKWQEPVTLLADHLTENLVTHEHHTKLAEVLHATRHQFRLGERRPEESDDNEHADQAEQHGLGEAKRADGEDRLEVEIVQGWCWIPASRENMAATRGGGYRRVTHYSLRQAPSTSAARGAPPPRSPRRETGRPRGEVGPSLPPAG